MKRFYDILFVYPLLPALLWAVFIFVVSGANPESLPSPDILAFDKIAHAVVYAFFCLLLFGWLIQKSHHKYVLILTPLFIAFTYGMLMEAVQWAFFPARSFDLYDAAANGIGCILFALSSPFLFKLK